MHAYELADEAKRQSQLIYLVAEEPVAKQLSQMLTNYETMIRQQADRIADLEKLVEEMKYEKSSGVYDVSSKPVAWMYQIHDITGWTWVIDQRLPDYEYRNEKPLYTHPVKQLSDEEWRKWFEKKGINLQDDHAGDVARAIIKEITE